MTRAFGLLSCGLVGVSILSLACGFAAESPWTVVRTLCGMGDPLQDLVILDLRLPRVVLAVLVGAGLAASGAILQAVSRNDLADAGTLGMTGGAGVGIVLLLLVNPQAVTATPALMPLGAFAGAVGAVGLTFLLATGAGALRPSRLLLVGVSVGMGLSGLMLLLPLRMSHEIHNYALDWITGSLVGAAWSQIFLIIPVLAALLTAAWGQSRALDILGLGDDSASSLGIDLKRRRIALICVASALAAICLSTAGGIPFVGLLAPHLARRAVGGRHSALLPASALCGALLMAASDGLARSLPSRSELPTGTVVGIIGGAYFLALLVWPSRRRGQP